MKEVEVIDRKKYSSEKFIDLERLNIFQQDWRSLMIRKLDLSKVRLDNIWNLHDCYCGGLKFDEDLDAKYVLDKLRRPGYVALDAGIVYYLCSNPELIPESWTEHVILFPGTIFCHKPYGQFWEPFSMLCIYQTKLGDGTKKWVYKHQYIHFLSQTQIFAYLDENDRDELDVITSSFSEDQEPE
jgi:hypothetical protein